MSLGGSSQRSAALMIFTDIDPRKVTAEQFEATCEARWPGLSLFIQNRFTGSVYNEQQEGGGGGGGGGGQLSQRCPLL